MKCGIEQATLIFVKVSYLQELVENLTPEFYQFSFVLLPDDLQAKQLTLDSLSVYLTEITPEEIKDLLSRGDDEDSLLLEEEVKLQLFQLIYKIGSKRLEQLGQSLNPIEFDRAEFKAFFKLSLAERAVLYLRHIEDCNPHQVGTIMSDTSAQALATLSSSRDKLLKMSGVEFDWLTQTLKGGLPLYGPIPST